MSTPFQIQTVRLSNKAINIFTKHVNNYFCFCSSVKTNLIHPTFQNLYEILLSESEILNLIYLRLKSELRIRVHG